MPIKQVQNPRLLDWGCIFLVKNKQQIIVGWNFNSIEQKIAFLKTANRMVIKRHDRHNHYSVNLRYGVKVSDAFIEQNKNESNYQSGQIC
jgi:hypothetical protein